MEKPDISREVWDMKYRYKTADGKPIDQTVEDTYRRVAKALSSVEKDPDYWYPRFYWALDNYRFTPAGRILAGAGTGRNVTLFNCFVMGTIPDSMDGIFSMLKEAAITMQQGGGIGYDFSTIRPKGTLVKGVDADASGPLTFMDVWDAMCRTVMSAGSRRGAMMATMRCDHPDIEDFITAKRDPNRLRMFNVSVLVTDKFMEAVKNNDNWDLVFDGRVYKTLKAKTLWDRIMLATYSYAEPGVIFIDRINEENNLNYMETISATNPCGEQPLPPYGACLLGSINLSAFYYRGEFAFEEMKRTVSIATRMLDNVVDVSKFPLKKQKDEALAKRRIGLGITGLGDVLALLGMKYGSDEAVAFTEKVLSTISDTAIRTSVALAIEKGAYPAYDEALLDSGYMKRQPEEVRELIQTHGIRNALLTSIAPTGTISLYAGNVSGGIEPIFALQYDRKILQKDGSHTKQTVKNWSVRKWEEENPGVPLPDSFVTAQTLSPIDHIKMQEVAQKYIDSSISKTVNVPETISFDDFANVYLEAYNRGCKGCTTYRPNDVTGSVLEVKDEEEISGECRFDPATGQKECS